MRAALPRSASILLVAACFAASGAALKVGAGAAAQPEPQPPSERASAPTAEPSPPADAPVEEAAAIEEERAAPGTMLRGLDDEGTCPAPLGLEFLRVATKPCRSCLKACLGAKIQAAQISLMKIQAPLSLLTWYLFKNRPFSMIPLEKALGKLFQVPAALYGGGAVGAYLSCRSLCDLDCPYPGGTPPIDELPELDGADPSNIGFLHRLYHRPARGGGGGGAFSNAVSEMFRVG
jgi:hypothetical protein